MPQHEFEIQFHESERILEVRYPSRPTLESYHRYEQAVRQTIASLGGQWNCLVDQSSLKVMPPELPPRIAELNAWAKERGMNRTARVVQASAIAELQANRILKNSGAQGTSAVTASRDEAWRALLA
ncbi:MAG: STAS/SEC14 domain-containing protein [Archangiaceae bacterium]|nr:STAS/SEC14 domain-containing protein [Archangiaceae bacterium]